MRVLQNHDLHHAHPSRLPHGRTALAGGTLGIKGTRLEPQVTEVGDAVRAGTVMAEPVAVALDGSGQQASAVGQWEGSGKSHKCILQSAFSARRVLCPRMWTSGFSVPASVPAASCRPQSARVLRTVGRVGIRLRGRYRSSGKRLVNQAFEHQAEGATICDCPQPLVVVAADSH